MPFLAPASDASGAFQQMFSMAGYGQVLFPPAQFAVPLPATIAAGSNWNSGVMVGDGCRNVSFAVQSTQGGSVIFQTYLDLAAAIPRPTPSTTSLTANTLVIVDLLATAATPLLPFVSWTLQISNTGGSVAALTFFQMILSAG